jgi:hypothetical protein|tara:strand:- start:627 stop:1007 length:381 start_codon:yes stop_codon:yes gene_type:complete
MDVLENNLIKNDYIFVPQYRKAFPILSMEQRHEHLDNIMKNVHVIPRAVITKIQKRHQQEKENQSSILQKTYRPTLTCKENYPQNDYLLNECEQIKFLSGSNFYSVNIFIFILLNIILILHATTKS